MALWPELQVLIVPLDKLNGVGGVLAHGCFDLVHIGHIRHLKEGRRLGSPLIVTITADKHISKPGRPRFPQEVRAEWLDSLSVVDYVSIVNDVTAIPAIEIIKPDIFLKGDDYRKTLLKEEWEAVLKTGGRVHYTQPRPEGISSTNLLREL